MSDKAGFVTGMPVAGPVAGGNGAGSNEAGSKNEVGGKDEAGSHDASPAAGSPAGEPPASRGGSLASVLQTLRDAASAHDDQAQTTRLPDTGPLTDRGD